jgi:hypothetical protein
VKFSKRILLLMSLALLTSDFVFAQETVVPTLKKTFKLKQKGEIYFRLRTYDKAISCDDQTSIYAYPTVISKKGSSHAILKLEVSDLSTLVEIECSDAPIADYRITPWNSINVQTAKTIQFNYPKYLWFEDMPFELIVQRERPCNLENIVYCD